MRHVGGQFGLTVHVALAGEAQQAIGNQAIGQAVCFRSEHELLAANADAVAATLACLETPCPANGTLRHKRASSRQL